jgi:hypothetical protein
MKTKERILIYISIIAAIIISSFFWGWPGQEINMRQARKEINKIEELLKNDERFADIKFGISTAALGKIVFVSGTLPDKESLEYLKELVEKNMSSKFEIRFHVEIKTDMKEPFAETNIDEKQVCSDDNSPHN